MNEKDYRHPVVTQNKIYWKKLEEVYVQQWTNEDKEENNIPNNIEDFEIRYYRRLLGIEGKRNQQTIRYSKDFIICGITQYNTGNNKRKEKRRQAKSILVVKFSKIVQLQFK